MTPILLYHSVCVSPPDWIAPYTVSPETFATHLDAVMATGLQPLTVSQFDDGFADFAENALPALADRKMPSTLYVTTGVLADRRPEGVLPPARMLSSADLPGLEAAGVEIGSHSHTHRQMDILPVREVKHELSLSGTLLAERLGHSIRSFAYPHGYWRRPILPLVREAGFDSACAVGNWLSSASDRMMALPRLMVTDRTDTRTVVAWLTGSTPPVTSRSYRASAFAWRQYRRAAAMRAVVGR
jgi:peptidoglycan/xylan/chitin deacetylase (PgdA/CDA1 family)